VTAALREIKIALLEADVALAVVKEFIGHVKEKAIGKETLESVTPGQMVVKVVYDHLVELLGAETVPLNLAAKAPVMVMLVGLQGSGKTTTTAKLARYIAKNKNKKVLMASLDVYRPAAQEQLEILGKQIDIFSLPIVRGEAPTAIAKRAEKMGRLEGYDVVLLDTAGRLHIDDTLMDELVQIKLTVNPTEIMLVADSMVGQDAVNIAKSFHEKIGLTGITLTRIDGDVRGGAALSMKSVTKCPIKFVGVGEHTDQLEEFHPDRIANLILGMGDVVTLVEKAAEAIDEHEAERLTQKMRKGKFDLNDLAKQLGQMSRMGGFAGIMKFLPGVGRLQNKMDEVGIDDTVIKHQIALIGSMTKIERYNPKLLKASRKRRVAAGAGLSVQEVNLLLKKFKDIQVTMKRMNKFGYKGLKRHGLKDLFL
jgi:signal recognition particle subunit SRP54